MNRKQVTILALLTVLSCYALIAGCESDAQTGGLVGAGVGALAGQAIGGDTQGTLIGAAIGGGAGYAVGNERDKKAAEADRNAIREEMNYVSVNFTTSNGSILTVRLRKEGVGYRGPKGEYYPTMPNESQLNQVYGF
ncbi:MAG: glycine zipper domain-containing protein [Planctomycetota bacterium]